MKILLDENWTYLLVEGCSQFRQPSRSIEACWDETTRFLPSAYAIEGLACFRVEGAKRCFGVDVGSSKSAVG
jgi:hypothetical protein